MGTNNAINANSTGLVRYNGTGTYDAVTTTNHNILIGATSNGITNVAPSASAGPMLLSNGSSADPSFKAFSLNIQSFTSSGTYTPTSGMQYCIIECAGGGGGGGGAGATGAGTIACGGGGGGGGYSRVVASAATIGVSQSVTIGAGGSGGTNVGGNGGVGGTTSLGAICSATGGNGGNGSAAITVLCAQNGGFGGAGTSGSGVNFTGGGGFPSYGLASTPSATGGSGGSCALGAGALGTVNTLAGTGIAGQIYGGGGAGAANATNTGAGSLGGAGAAGVCYVTEFIWS